MQKNICIVYPNVFSYSETFIHAHVKHLPGNKKILYGGWFPKFTERDIPLALYYKKNLFDKIYHSLNARLFGKIYTPNPEAALLCFFEQNKIDMVLAEYGPTGQAIMDICEKVNIPFIVHFHGFDAYHYQTIEKYTEQYKTMFQKASAVIAVSMDMRYQLISLGSLPEKTFLNVYGIDIDFFKPNSTPLIHRNFICVGRFVNKKAPHLSILAFQKVLTRFPDARLVIVGDGGTGNPDQLFEACKQLVHALNIQHAVIFTGALDPDQLRSKLQSSFAFIQHSVRPSCGDSEGAPNTILEASACGLPIVATRHAGIKDIVIENLTGFLVDEYDVEGMAQHMIHLAGNPYIAQQMGMEARKRVVEHYSMEKSINGLWKIIQRSMDISEKK